MKPKAMTVAGVMSGTSADGIDVALVRITPTRETQKVQLLAHESFRFPAELRAAVLAAMESGPTTTAELARLNWRLGKAYADAVRKTRKKYAVQLDLIGCHGQTVYHQSASQLYAGHRFACTWQIGEPALLAAALGVPVVSNFRPADMVAGGQGAPLVPLLDFVFFCSATRARVLQNIGGIGNLTLVPANAGTENVIAFDTGPGNMIIDALVQQNFSLAYDRDGRIAAQGRVLEAVLRSAMQHKFFRTAPPKSAGREQFGHAYARDFLQACRKAGASPEDAVATATALTAASIHGAFERWVKPLTHPRPVDYILSGGGARNHTLVRMLRERLEPLGCNVLSSAEAGLPVEAKEAVAFALLAYYTWHRRPANLPSATGAKRSAILGQITYV